MSNEQLAREDGGAEVEHLNHLDILSYEDKRDYECDNCRSPTTESAPCEVCGAEPHNGIGWRIECVVCETVAFGDPGQSVEHDMFMHRVKHCPEAEFEVTLL